MEATIRKWGNSPALRLGAGSLRVAGLELDQKVNVLAMPGRIVIEPVTDADLRLENLVAGITEANRHGEVQTGGPVGSEHP